MIILSGKSTGQDEMIIVHAVQHQPDKGDPQDGVRRRSKGTVQRDLASLGGNTFVEAYKAPSPPLYHVKIPVLLATSSVEPENLGPDSYRCLTRIKMGSVYTKGNVVWAVY